MVPLELRRDPSQQFAQPPHARVKGQGRTPPFIGLGERNMREDGGGWDLKEGLQSEYKINKL